ncbi:transposase [Streptomyces sp. NPDC005318]|uniref:transposase n=1 Tax=Streptomyces sp. NPDC005318 TaxID=3157031 RepID=UPI0033B4983D
MLRTHAFFQPGHDVSAKIGGVRRLHGHQRRQHRRKRHVVTDCLGLLLVVAVTAANVGDREAAVSLLARLRAAHHTIRLVWVGGSYTGHLIDWARDKLRLTLEIVKRSHEPRLVVLPRRWVVERSLSWLMRSRHLVRDYETLPATSEAMVLSSMTILMSRRLARRTDPRAIAAAVSRTA